jgi:hypothetical protein
MKNIAAYALLTGTMVGLLPQTALASSLEQTDSALVLNMGNERPRPAIQAAENPHGLFQ